MAELITKNLQTQILDMINAADPARLRQWNDANAQALKASGETIDAQLIENISQTAALIIASGKPRDAQNLELIRALSLYDSTLSSKEIAVGFVNGMIDKSAELVKPLLAFTEPSSMNLSDAQQRTDALQQRILTSPQTAIDSLSTAIDSAQLISDKLQAVAQHPENMASSLVKVVSAVLSEFEQGVANTITGDKPSYMLGAVLGSGVASVVLETFHPSGKATKLSALAQHLPEQSMEYDAYAKLLGAGSAPPRLKPLRDFSADMLYELPAPNQEYSRLSYIMSESHRFIADLRHEWTADIDKNQTLTHTTMSFLVIANDTSDRDRFGNGPEMFHSALKALQKNNLHIDQIDGLWSDYDGLTTNYDAFNTAREQGMSIKQAVRHTPTGRWVADAGFTEITGDMIAAPFEGDKSSHVLIPNFNRPTFSSDASYNQYGEKFVDTYKPELVAKDKAILPAQSLSSLMYTFNQLPVTHQATVMRHVLDKHKETIHDADLSANR